MEAFIRLLSRANLTGVPAPRPLVEERIRERRRMRSMNNLPEIHDLHRK